ncbi:PP2C family serine/threonine-protein phosphatase [Actinotalea sp.]|uniref:PP2C family protein-serine/threonine phosphatase n=1 Tax=Actinotalea sp. TaxID=1872145 RepID=UPI00356A380F
MRPALRTELRSAVGEHRSTNQDSAGAGPSCAIVADGVGGRAAGDVASAHTVHTVLAALTADPEPQGWDADAVRGVVARANAGLAALSAQDPTLIGMATTLTAIVAVDDAVLVAHVGDSRAYLVHAGEGHRVTRDDSLVQELVDQGSVDPADAWQHPHRNIILWSLSGGLTDPGHLRVQRVPTVPGDRWLLASDGLTDYVAEQQVLQVLVDEQDPAAAADTLMAMALGADARDNVTLAVVDVVDGVDDLPPAAPVAMAGAALALAPRLAT